MEWAGVYLASGPGGALVAVKQIDPRYAEDKGFRAWFAREVDACSRVLGAFTAAVITADPDARRPWLASVYVPGPSLAEAQETAGALPVRQVRFTGVVGDGANPSLTRAADADASGHGLRVSLIARRWSIAYCP